MFNAILVVTEYFFCSVALLLQQPLQISQSSLVL